MPEQATCYGKGWLVHAAPEQAESGLSETTQHSGTEGGRPAALLYLAEPGSFALQNRHSTSAGRSTLATLRGAVRPA